MNKHENICIRAITTLIILIVCMSIIIQPVRAYEDVDMQKSKDVLTQSATENDKTSKNVVESIPMPYYNQYNYANIPYMGKTIAARGCGIVSASMIATYLLQDETLTPEYLAETYGNPCNKHPNVNYENLMTVATSTLEELGIELTLTYDFVDVLNALIEGKPVLSLENPGLFTSVPNGHFVVYESVTEDGRFTIHDSNGYNWERNEYYHENGFPYVQVYESGSGYWICKLEKEVDVDYVVNNTN